MQSRKGRRTRVRQVAHRERIRQVLPNPHIRASQASCRRIRPLIIGCIVCGVLVPVVSASSAETTPGEFATQGNAICRQEFRRTDRLDKRIANLFGQNKIAAAGRLVVLFGRIQLRAAARIAQIPRPSQIAAKIQRLVDSARASSRLIIHAGQNFAQDRVGKGQRLLRRAEPFAKQANRLSRQLGLAACAD